MYVHTLRNLILISNINSQLNLEAGYDPNNPNNFLWYSTFSVLFKNINPITNGNNLNYYYNQLKSFLFVLNC